MTSRFRCNCWNWVYRMGHAGLRTPKRILMTADTVGGVWVYALELSRALRERGIEVVLATMGAPVTPDQWEDVRRIPDVKVFESGFRLEWMDKPWPDVSYAGSWLLRLEESLEPDLIHLNSYAHGALPWRRPKLVVGHSCVLSWWEAVIGGTPPPVWERYCSEVTCGLGAADYVVAPSEAMLSALRRHYKKHLAGGVVPNGRNPVFFHPGVKEDFVMTVGRLWDKAKNAEVFRHVAPGLSWPVYVAGEESLPNGMAGISGAGGAGYGSRKEGSDNIHCLGRLSSPAVASWLSRASIYALPAYYEPFGLSALEAGLSGCALVLGDILSLREIWGEAAVFVPPGDPVAIRDAIRALIGNPSYRKTMAERVRARALEFSPERMAEGYIAVYRYLMAGKREKRLKVEG